MSDQEPESRFSKLLRGVRDWLLAMAVAVVVFMGVVALQSGGSVPAEGPAPDFAVDTLDDDGLALVDLKGQTVVLNFWASWCGPCRAEMPDLKRFSADYPDVQMVGVAVDSGDKADVARAARTFGMTWTVALASGAMKSDYGVNVLPTTVVIDAEGQLVSRHRGQLDYSDLVAMLP